MECSLDQILDETLADVPGIYGVLCTDHQGLCLSVRGKASSKCSGIIANIANKVSEIEPLNEDYPVILLESENLQCMIQKEENITFAMFKSPPPSSN